MFNAKHRSHVDRSIDAVEPVRFVGSPQLALFIEV